jgi:hypothetical protein
VQLVRKLRIYPWSGRDTPKRSRLATAAALQNTSGPCRASRSIPPDGIEYWARLATYVNNNLVHERDRFFMATVKLLGIEKGSRSSPTRGTALSSRMLPGSATRWREVVLMDPDQESDTYSQLDGRLHYFYGAIYMLPAIGMEKADAGSRYVEAFKDKDGNRIDGGKS